MAKDSKKTPFPRKSRSEGYAKLPFHSPSLSKTEKSEAVEKLVTSSPVLAYFGEVVSQSDWLKLRYDHENGVWLVMHTYTSNESGENVGIVTYRAKRLENALAFCIWKSSELSDTDFLSDDDDDY